MFNAVSPFHANLFPRCSVQAASLEPCVRVAEGRDTVQQMVTREETVTASDSYIRSVRLCVCHFEPRFG
jgi:hypothetical protein